MKNTIETVVLFSVYMINADKSNIDDVVGKIVCVIGTENILEAYEVTLGYKSKHIYNIKLNLARSIIMDLLQQKIKQI